MNILRSSIPSAFRFKSCGLPEALASCSSALSFSS
jgi:hypothetical protein